VFAGIDAGTKSYRIAVLDDSCDLYDLKNAKITKIIEVPTERVKKRPEEFVKLLKDINADVYSGLSGYGLPVKHFSELSERDIKLMTLTLERNSSVGLRKLLRLIPGEMEFYTIPAVIHLPSVPEHRKFCRIDMGTYDKLCSAIAAIAMGNENFVLAEVGYGYSSFLAVRDGKIVDGLGGSSFLPSYGSVGCLDSEIAYLLGEFSKSLLMTGLRELEGRMANRIANSLDRMSNSVMEALAENVVKGIAAISTTTQAEKVFLSGRFAETLLESVRERVRKLLGESMRVKVLSRNSSALGAAAVSSAIAGGKFRRVVERAEIFSAKGTILDYLPEKIREIVERRLFS